MLNQLQLLNLVHVHVKELQQVTLIGELSDYLDKDLPQGL